MNETSGIEEIWMRPLMESYWEGKPWSHAVAEHKVSSLLKFPHKSNHYTLGLIDIKKDCQRCGGKIVSYFATREQHKEGHTWAKSASCVNCGHKPFNIENCWCDICKIEKRQIRNHQQEEMRQMQIQKKITMTNLVKESVERHNSECIDVGIDSCLYDGCAILIAMLEQSTSENPSCITPLRESPKPFAPSPEYGLELIQKVIAFLKFAVPIPSSAHVQDQNLYWNGFDETYMLIESVPNPKKYLLDQLKSYAFDCGDAELIALDIEQLMLQEALSFLKQTRNEYRLPHQVGDKTRLVLKNLILNRPLNEVLFFIHKGCQEAAALVQKRAMTIAQASNSIIGNIERFDIRARDLNWQFKPWQRFRFEEQSWLSYVYFNLVLGLSGKGLEYSLLDVMKHQRLNVNPESNVLLKDFNKEAFEALLSLKTESNIN